MGLIWAPQAEEVLPLLHLPELIPLPAGEALGTQPPPQGAAGAKTPSPWLSSLLLLCSGGALLLPVPVVGVCFAAGAADVLIIFQRNVLAAQSPRSSKAWIAQEEQHKQHI